MHLIQGREKAPTASCASWLQNLTAKPSIVAWVVVNLNSVAITGKEYPVCFPQNSKLK